MKKLYKVSRVVEDKVEIIPYDKSACSNCSSSCSGCRVVLTARNPKKLELKTGMTVTASVLTAFQGFCNVIALFIPVLSAIGGFFLSSPIATLFKTENTESFKALCVLVFLFVPGLIIFLLTRKRSGLIELQVTGIED